MQINNLSEFNQWVLDFKSQLSEKEIIILSGPMGAGKTQFVQSLLQDSENIEVMSPTFSIHNKYSYKNISVDHIDLYRLEGDADLESTGFWELFVQEKGWIIVEWGDRLDLDMYPSSWSRWLVKIDLVNENKNSRTVSVKPL